MTNCRFSTSTILACYILNVRFTSIKMSVILIVVQIIVISALIVGLYQKNTNLICKSKKRLEGKTILVTGGTCGMGLEIAKDFAHRGAKVIVACPFKDEGLDGLQKIIQSSGNQNVVFKLLDLASLTSVRDFAADIIKTEDRLDILVNNAGVADAGRRVTKDGMDFIMQVNYFGTFLLTLLLLPLLKKSGDAEEPSRIVNTTSVFHWIGSVNFTNWNSKKINWITYADSKLCVILFTRELAKRLKNSNVVVNVVDPGAVGTRIFHNAFKEFGLFTPFVFSKIFKNPWEGAQTAIHAAVCKSAAGMSGEYFRNCKIVRPSNTSFNDELAGRLWEETVRIVQLKHEESI